MPTITVHQYLTWDHQNGRSVASRGKATLDAIKLASGKIVPGTAEEIALSALDGRGRYVPEEA
jgi:hypothetical protein